MEESVVIRDINKDEVARLGDFLYDAIFIPEGQERPGREIIRLPELSRYTDDFGKDTDVCLVAVIDGELVGALWTRVFSETGRGFGYVDDYTPELSMSVSSHYRQRGIGTSLLEAMIDRLSRLGYEQVSLSVDRLNYAYKLYRRFGFEDFKSDGQSVTMVKCLKNSFR